MNPAPATPSLRLTRPGMYPVEYARWLLNPLRYLIMPPGRMADRPQLLPRIACSRSVAAPGFSARPSRAEFSAGHLTLFDAQALMLEMA
jgi:hypothetical protein